MKKFLTLLLISVLLVGCSKEETADNNMKDVYKLVNGDEIILDLDGDGTEERIAFSCNMNTDYDYCESVKLTVESSKYEPELCSPIDTCYIVRLDKKENFYTILLGDAGPSCDYETDLVVYKNSSLKHIGNMPGVYDADFPMNEGLRFNFDGTVTAPVRADVLQTWWFDANFKVTKDSVEMIEQDFYDVDYDTELLLDLEVYEKPDVTSEKTIVRSETPMTFIAHDNKEWVKVRYNDIYGNEQESYFRCYICYLDETCETYLGDVFKNLCFAD